MNGPSGVGRRAFLVGGAATAGAAAAFGAERLLDPGTSTAESASGTRALPFHGKHQNGIAMATPQAHQSLIAFTLRPGTSKDSVRRLLTILTDDARRMTGGEAALADTEPDFASTPARLTVTFGLGPKVVELVRGRDAVPAWLKPLPAYPIDRLDPAWNGGDLLLQVASDDPLILAHNVRMLTKDTRSFAAVTWHQPGFRNAVGTEPPGTTMRNLLGQLDGTVNPQPGTREFDELVWRDDDWLDGGSTMVVRRIAMRQDSWDELDHGGREQVIGRRLDNGAPLTGTHEHDVPDLDATTPGGLPVIAGFAHIRRARGERSGPQLLRRGYNYDLGPDGDQASRAGLVFTAFQRDIDTQYKPIQERLAKLDLLNTWTVPIGSAVFAIPAGIRPNEFAGQALFA